MYSKRIKLALLAVSFILCCTISLSIYGILSYEYYYNGIFIDGIKIAGLTKAQAVELLSNEFSKNYQVDERSLALVYEDKIWRIPLNSIEYRFDFDTTLDYAYKIGREGNWLKRFRTIKNTKSNHINLITQGKYNNAIINEYLKAVKKEIDFLSIPSTYKYNYGKIIYTKDVAGRIFDIDKNYKLIEKHILNRNFDNINLIVETVKPTITVEDVKKLKDVLASFTTVFNENNYSRAHNIKLACQKINNLILLPGEEFSMDTALGPRTPEHGFMQAPIIIKSTLVSGTGGGVCQVASTLYNSVLLSMLQITSRVGHSRTLNYVPPGQDATISEGFIDFKFKNNRDYTISIVSEVYNGCITVKIIGKKRDNEPIVKLRPLILEEYAPPTPEYVVNDSLSDNDVEVKIKPKKGINVVLYRDSYNKQGELINSEKISQDVYKPVRGIIAVNRKMYRALKNIN